MIIASLLWFHQQADLVDEDEIVKLDKSLDLAKSCMHIDGALLAADFFFFSGDLDSAASCLKHTAFIQSKNEQYDSYGSRQASIERSRIQCWLHEFHYKQKDHNKCSMFQIELKKYLANEENVDCLMIQAK